MEIEIQGNLERGSQVAAESMAAARYVPVIFDFDGTM
jgi:hypothetical protein